jgi:glycosyltransferase involved in cell wall biosynthesis
VLFLLLLLKVCKDQVYGGLESICSEVALGASKRGHEVTLVTVKGSSLVGKFEWKDEDGNVKGSINTIETGGTDIPWGYGEDQHYDGYRKLMEKEFGHGEGIVWDNTWQCHSYRSIYESYLTNMKIIHTHHGMLGWNRPPPFVVHWPRFLGLSSAHATLMSQILGIPVRYVHNGIPMPELKELPPKGEYLLSLNRIMDEKGIHHAIDIAMKNRIPIKIAGDDRMVPDHAYVHRIIETCRNSGGMAEYYGLVDNDTKQDLLRNCKALISCPQNTARGVYMEAFGLNLVEGLSYGKPVLSLANGGPIDIIQHGKSGFLAPNPSKLSEYVANIDDIDTEECRKRAELFSSDNMVDKYLEIFQGVLGDDAAFKW